MLTTRWLLAIAAVAVPLAGWAGLAASADERASARITVFAASSLTDVFPKIDSRPRYSFAASNTLAQQIRQGAPADVFASADVLNPQRLRAAGSCGKPRVFATNTLVVVVPRSNPGGVKTVRDLRRPGVKVVIAQPGVPVGDYTRKVLANLGIARAVLANVVSQEPDVRSVLAKVALGEADAGFVYRTDAATLKGRIGVVKLPAGAQPPIRYAACVVRSSTKRAEAQAFVMRLLGKTGRARLVSAGFGVP
jgi:molybdate transport system substrate-binding protein